MTNAHWNKLEKEGRHTSVAKPSGKPAAPATFAYTINAKGQPVPQLWHADVAAIRHDGHPVLTKRLLSAEETADWQAGKLTLRELAARYPAPPMRDEEAKGR